MAISLIDETSRYRFEKIERSPEEPIITSQIRDQARTLFVHKGKATLSYLNGGKSEIKEILAGQGFISVSTDYTIAPEGDFLAFQTTSNLGGKDVLETIDDGLTQKQVSLSGIKIVSSPKRVNKPWGHELWISWLNCHVLKQIGMTAGRQSSLQLHRYKLETNYLTSGRANVIDRYPMPLNIGEETMREIATGVDWHNYMKEYGPGTHWTSDKGIVHRVISLEDYIAYETSTPELDDVIRLSDVSGRTSGRIVSEHR